jgi:hypothetical protein
VASTARVRLYRERLKTGKELYTIALDVVALEELLIHEGLLQPGVDHDHDTVEAALQRFLQLLHETRFPADD